MRQRLKEKVKSNIIKLTKKGKEAKNPAVDLALDEKVSKMNMDKKTKKAEKKAAKQATKAEEAKVSNKKIRPKECFSVEQTQYIKSKAYIVCHNIIFSQEIE